MGEGRSEWVRVGLSGRGSVWVGESRSEWVRVGLSG